jgi:hypothetical protein
MSVSGRERRKHPRAPASQLISFTPFSGAAGLGEGGDVSLGGIRFTAVGCALRNDDLLQVSFNLGERTVDAVGRVVWLNKLDAITTEVGLEFVRIDAWVARLLEEQPESCEADFQTPNKSS